METPVAKLEAPGPNFETPGANLEAARAKFDALGAKLVALGSRTSSNIDFFALNPKYRKLSLKAKSEKRKIFLR